MKNVFFELTFLAQILKFKIPHMNIYAVIFIFTQYPHFYCHLLKILPERSQHIDPNIYKLFIELFSKILLFLD